jgi:hypothetical protein
MSIKFGTVLYIIKDAERIEGNIKFVCVSFIGY